jgi:hypothetical protein
LSFPIDVVPVSEHFDSGFFFPDNLEGTGDIADPPTEDVIQWEQQML